MAVLNVADLGGALIDGVVPRLARIGFKKRAGEIFTCDLGGDVLGWIGLNRGHRGGVLEINPVVGVRHQRVERLVAEALGEKFHAYIPPTVSVPLSQLAEGRYKPWLIEGIEDGGTAAGEIAGEIELVGLPFMRANADVRTLVDSLEAGLVATLEQRAMRLPVALAVAGEEAGAERVLRAELERVAGREDLAAQRFRQFAEGFRLVVRGD